ncbi:MAG: alpha/beta hydrolase [Desulfobacteraceae bacterium]|nr:alpha/beta hydrolase [Desulfobacteraceae bacterium]
MQLVFSDSVHKDKHLKVNGVRIGARWLRHTFRKKRSDPILVFLHEGLGCIDMWGDFPQKITTATGLDGFLFDRSGHGGSDPLASHEIDLTYLEKEAFSFLPELLQKEGIKNSIFFGHSDGGTIALMYTARYGKHVTAVITEAAHVYVDYLTIRGVQNAVHNYKDSNLKQRLTKFHGQNTDSMFWRWAKTWMSEEFSTWNIEHMLKNIHCPVLAIQGEDDQYGLPEQAVSIINGLGGSGETCFIPECGHVPHRQAKQAVVDKCCKFIQSLAGRAYAF